MYSKAGIGYCLVISPAAFKIGTGKKGIDGIEIIIDHVFNPIKNAVNHAEVIQIPVEMGSIFLGFNSPGPPGYGATRLPENIEQDPGTDLYTSIKPKHIKFVSDIEPEVKVGDKIYFKARTLANPANFMGALKNEKGKNEKYIYKVPYENILCAVRDGQIIMIGSWVLIEPIFEDFESILRPTYYQSTDQFGNKVQRPKSQWIQTKVAPEHDNLRGKIFKVGSPLKGEKCDIKEGDIAVFRKPKTYQMHGKKVSDGFQEVEGKKYIVLRQDNVLAKLLYGDVKVK